MMNIQAEKFKLIEWLVQLQDPTMLEKLLEFKKQAEIASYEAKLKPMTKEELTARAEASEEAIAKGQVSNIESISEEDWD